MGDSKAWPELAGVGISSFVVVAAVTTGSAHAANPVDVGVAMGFVAGRGHIGESQARVEDIAGPGAAFEAHLGWNATPTIVLGAYGGYSWHERGLELTDASDVRSVSAGLYAELHIGDPWIGVSTGWRGLRLEPENGKTTDYHAWELMRVQVGIDRRVATYMVLAPVVAVALTTFVAQDSPQTNEVVRLSDPGASIFVFAGMQARFGEE